MKKIIISLFTAASVLLCGAALAETTACTESTALAASKTAKRTRAVYRVFYPAAKIEFEAKEAPAYKIVSEPQSPYVVRGLFRDRVVQPKRQKLSIVTEE